MKQIVFILIIIAVLASFLKFVPPESLSFLNKNSVSNPDLIIFWGQGCPHCENVKKFISDNEINSKLKLTLKEVYLNKKNQEEMKKDANECPEIDISKGIGVPFGFVPSEHKCIIGDQPIIDWINTKIATPSVVLK